ncbi:MAG: FliH/SctL family protein [Acidobacteriota bacterium]|nr:FliH/SctL family protein [Acidobacteriota bacterium]
MLSKVLSGAETAGIEKLIFPQLKEPLSASRISFGTPPDSAGQTGDLRAQIQQLELRLDSERREAFEAGRAAGGSDARAELQPVLERLNNSTAEILAMRGDLRRRAERDVVQLALLIAQRVLHRQLTVDEEALTAIARVAFERLSRSESYRITVNPKFAAAVSSVAPASHASRVEFDLDPDCAPGTLIVRSSDGANGIGSTLDASIDTQLEEIGRGLTDRLSSPLKLATR